MIIRAIRIKPRRIAAVAPQLTDEQVTEREARRRLPEDVDNMCREWGAWVATRRLAAPRPIGSVIGRLRTASATGQDGGPRVALNQHAAAFHCALLAQDERGLAVLWGMYALPAQGVRVPVKRLADALGIHRATVYRVRDEVATRAYNGRLAVIDAVSLARGAVDSSMD